MKDEIQNLMYYIIFLKPSGLSKYCLKSSDYRNKCFKPTNNIISKKETGPEESLFVPIYPKLHIKNTGYQHIQQVPLPATPRSLRRVIQLRQVWVKF